MVAAYSDRDQESYDKLAKLIEEQQVEGIVFFQGGPVRQSLLLNRYQSLLTVPALVAMDAEWGVGMRLDRTVSFPYQKIGRASCRVRVCQYRLGWVSYH